MAAIVKDKFSELRQRAQVFLATPPATPVAMSTKEIRRLVHELDTYQIELEIQNEDLRQTQEQLLQSQKKYSDLYDFAPVGYLTVSGKGLVAEANLTASSMLGIGRKFLLQQPFSLCIPPEEQDSHYLCRKRLLETQEAQTCERRMTRRDGSVFDVHCRCVVRPEVDGDSGQYRMVISDISQRRELEQAVAAKNRLNRILLDTFPCAAMLINPDTYEIAASNRSAMEQGAVPGKTCFATWGKREARCPECKLPDLRRSGKPQQAEYEEHGRFWEAYWQPVSEDLFMHYIFDATLRHRKEEQLKQALKMQAVGTLAGGIAHEFNNLLGVIMGRTEMVGDEMAQGSFAKQQLDGVMKASFRLKDLVKQILTFSRQSMQKLSPVCLESVVQEALKLTSTSLPSSVDVRLELSCGSVKSFVDPTEIQQIVMNVCANAVSAMNEKGTLEIALKPVHIVGNNGGLTGLPAGEYALLSFRDTGIGMDKETLARIFEPFFTTKEVGRGTGMGLSITHGIMETYGGKIMVESEPDTGSVFHFYFPVTSESSEEYVEPVTVLPKGTERILFVDDDDLYAQMGAELIGRLGYAVDPHRSSMEALAAFKAAPESFDLVIADQVMPGLTGEELVREIRTRRPDMPIVLCTGYSERMDEEKAEALGINAFVLKPYDKRAIAEIIRRALDGG